MKIKWNRQLIVAILSLISVFMLGSKTHAITETKLLASDGAENDFFGESVSISGDVALVGAYANDDNGSSSGSAYVFRWNGSNWVEEQKLLASDAAAGDFFGRSVSISGDVALVGADQLIGVNSRTGSAYVFRWNGSSWIEEQKLLASDGAADDSFGWVSISGDVALVGAFANDDYGEGSGSAYVFRWNGNSWVEEQKLLASDGAAGDMFGKIVSISGDVAVVGALGDDDNGTSSGSAYVFRWNGNSWVEEQKLLATDGAAFDNFGHSVSISGDVILVGATQVVPVETRNGSAYVFRWNGSSWVQEQKLLASDGAAGDYFGFEVSISGDMALVGANHHDDNGNDSGSAYVYNFLISEIQISIDIIPKTCPNECPIKGGSSVEVAILGSVDLDVDDIDIASVLLEGVAPTRSSLKDKSSPVVPFPTDCECTTEGRDGFIDLCLKFDKKAIISALGEVNVDEEYVLTLSGELSYGTPIEGNDCIVFVEKGKKD